MPASPAPSVTIEQALQQACAQLSDNPAARLEAELLLALALACPRTTLRAWPKRPLTAPQSASFQQYLARRLGGEPVAYILGQREFWTFTLKVTPDTLIPRPETEHLVELALQRIPTDAHWQLADLGTGSGAIALALASERPHCQVTATDSSNAALEVARENARTHDIQNIRFQCGHWFAPLSQQHFHVIVSNPPYVAQHDPHLQQGDLRFEPQRALSAGPDGIDDLQHIIEASPAHLVPNGWLLLEHGFDQGSTVTQLLRQRGFAEVQCFDDYAERERVSCGRWPG
jgi:release factor glutamine methyltransferase